MGTSWKLRAAMAALVLYAASAAFAECVSGTRGVSVRGVFPNRAAGAVAWNGNLLAVAKTDVQLNNRVYVALYDESLNQLTDDLLVADSSRTGAVSVLWNGSEFAVFYQSSLASLKYMYQRVSPLGQKIGEPITVAPLRLVFPLDEMKFAWNPARNQYAVVRASTQGPDRGLWYIGVERDGTLASELQISRFQALQSFATLAVAANGTVGVVYLHTTDTLHYVAITPDDQFTLSKPISTIGRTPDIAARGNVFGVVMTANVDTKNVVRWLRIDTNGDALAAEKTLFEARNEVELDELVGTDHEWALAYGDSLLGLKNHPGDYRLRRFEDDGTVISDSLFSHDALLFTVNTKYPFVWTGTSYISTIAYFESNVQGSDSYLLRNCPLRGVPSVDRAVFDIRKSATFSASVSGGTPDYKYFWDFGDHTEIIKTPTATHRYDRTGTYSITLTVTDFNGAKSVETVQVRVIIEKRRAAGH